MAEAPLAMYTHVNVRRPQPRSNALFTPQIQHRRMLNPGVESWVQSIPRFAEDFANMLHDCMMVQVTISASQAGKQAKARAIVRETGHLVGIRIPEGCEYRHDDLELFIFLEL